MDCMCQICTCVPSALVTPDINTGRSAEKRFFNFMLHRLKSRFHESTKHLDVYQRSLSAIHLHAAVHNCGRGQSNWGLRSCLKYFVFCRLLWLWLFFFCLVDRCLVVVWSYCCVPFSEEEKNNSCFVVIQNFAFLTLCWQLWVCPASPSCNATISFPARQPWASFFPLDFRRNAQNRFPSKKCIRFPTQGAHSSISWEAADDRVINTCHSSEAVIMLLLLLFFLFVCFFCCHSRWIQHLFRS